MSKWRNRISGHGEESPDQLMANPQNHRIHPKHQQQVMAGALDEIGWIQDIIVNTETGHVIDGHLRIEIALREEEPSVPVKYVSLTLDEERKALASLDPIGALAEQDQDMLDQLLDDIGDVEDDHLAAFFEGMHSPEDDTEPETEGLTDEDEAPELGPSPISLGGDVWRLGEHRLMCGDGISITDVERLCDEPIDLVWTDPPYNVNYEGKTEEALKIGNDEMGDDQFRTFLRDLFTSAYAVTREGGPIYVAHADSEGINFRSALVEAGFLHKQCLIWVKNTMVLGRQDYQWQHEPILYGWKPGAAHRWYGEFNKKTVIDHTPDLKEMNRSELVNQVRVLQNALNTSALHFDKPARSGEHPTMKPVELIAHMIKNSSRKRDQVLDLCAGSGSTLIACEKYGRTARLMEYDPKYTDVIIRRWQKFTGQEAIHEGSGQTFNELEAARQTNAEETSEANA